MASRTSLGKVRQHKTNFRETHLSETMPPCSESRRKALLSSKCLRKKFRLPKCKKLMNRTLKSHRVLNIRPLLSLQMLRDPPISTPTSSERNWTGCRSRSLRRKLIYSDCSPSTITSSLPQMPSPKAISKTCLLVPWACFHKVCRVLRMVDSHLTRPLTTGVW